MSAYILIMDDEPSCGLTYKIVLEAGGYRVNSTTDAEQALTLLAEERRFDAFITDMNHPGPSGIELFKAAKEVDPEMVLIMITGYITAEVERQATRFGDLLCKPLDFEELMSLLKKRLEQRAKRMTRS